MVELDHHGTRRAVAQRHLTRLARLEVGLRHRHAFARLAGAAVVPCPAYPVQGHLQGERYRHFDAADHL
ncbi:MAG TPA: hypothetical protein VFZ89_10340, partial [Solirubrobacteraceae bacterium]